MLAFQRGIPAGKPQEVTVEVGTEQELRWAEQSVRDRVLRGYPLQVFVHDVRGGASAPSSSAPSTSQIV